MWEPATSGFAGTYSRSCVGPIPASPERESAMVGVGALVLFLSFGFKSSNLAHATLDPCKDRLAYFERFPGCVTLVNFIV